MVVLPVHQKRRACLRFELFFIVPVDAIVLFCFLKSPGVTRLPDSNRRTLPK